MTLTQGQIIQSRYRVVSLLGQGGFGAVYRAWDINLNQPVAIKENLDTSPEAQRQFQHEALILANLSHPNLPRVTDHFLIPGLGQYLVMDFVEGEDLQAMLNRTGRALPEAQVLAWIDQICGALAHLHEQEPPVIHRDIKPANIKITPKGKAVLVDFGIAKVFDPVLKTTVGARAVTPGYSPPEQYGQGQTDQRSDVYSLGATLYTLLTGQEPPESVNRVANNIPLIPPRQLVPLISLNVEAAILHACEVSTTRRFQTMAELRQALAGRPLAYTLTQVVTPPVSLPQPRPRGEAVAPIILAGVAVLGVLIILAVLTSRPVAAPAPTQAPTAAPTAVTPTVAVASATPTSIPATIPTPPIQTQTNIYATATAISNEAIKVRETGSGTIAFDKDRKQISISSNSSIPDLSLANFVAEAKFHNSYSFSEKDWQYGIAGRWKGSSLHVVFVSSQHTWRHIILEDGVERIIEEGKFSVPVNLEANEINSLRIIVLGRQGQLWINGEFVTNLDMSNLMSAGNVMVTIWDTPENLLKFDKPVQFTDFVVWTLN
jgi:serine/threonine protein kinase